jgi:hypothetical protein
MWLTKGAFVGKRNFDIIKMHGTTIKTIKNLVGYDAVSVSG